MVQAIERGLGALLTYDLKSVMPLDEADRQLGGVAPKPHLRPLDPRPTAERLNIAFAAEPVAVSAVPAGVSTFAARPNAPAAAPLAALPAEYHRIKHVLRTLKDQLEFKLSNPKYDLVTEARQQALAIADQHFGADLANAPDARRAEVFSYGRALLDEVDRWAETRLESIER